MERAKRNESAYMTNPSLEVHAPDHAWNSILNSDLELKNVTLLCIFVFYTKTFIPFFLLNMQKEVAFVQKTPAPSLMLEGILAFYHAGEGSICMGTYVD